MSEAAPGLPTGPLHLLSDKRLAQRAAGGDQRAFEVIYSRYHQSLYRFCLAMVGTPQDAQDTLQNAMVKVLRALPGEKREIQLKPWLYRIARNESVETLRRRRESDELGPDLAEPVGVADTAEARERLRALLADLEQLPERQRAALVMRELSGLDFAEIGAAFGSSPAVARQTLYEARLSLRQLEAGREMRCADVMRELSDADGRVTRRREIRAHLRGCAECRAFREQIAKRHEDLAAIAPLPIAASAGLLHGALGGSTGGGASGAGIAGSVGAGTGKVVATSAIVKSAATVAVIAVVGASAADRSGLIDLPLPGGHGSANSAQESRGAAGGASSGSGATGAASNQPANGGARSGGPTSNSSPANGDGDSSAKSDATPGNGTSNSQAGANPPGGGYGRSASERHGRPEQPPAAAAHGQQTSGAHKSPHATSPTGPSPSGGGKGGSSGGGSPPVAKPPVSSGGKPQAAPAAPPVEAPPQAQTQAQDGQPEARPDVTSPRR